MGFRYARWHFYLIISYLIFIWAHTFIYLYACLLFWIFLTKFVWYLCTVIDAQGPVATALFLGEPGLFNTSREDCIWKRGNDRDQCPDADITMTFFPAKNLHSKSKVWLKFQWIRQCCWKLCHKSQSNEKKLPFTSFNGIWLHREKPHKNNQIWKPQWHNLNETLSFSLFLPIDFR